MSRVVNSIKYKCLECGREYRVEKYAIECEIDDKERKRVVKDGLDKTRRVSSLRNTNLYYANSLKDFEAYLKYMTYGFTEDWEYEEYDYPCTVLIHEYEEIECYEEAVTSYIKIVKLDDFMNELESERVQLERKFEMGNYTEKEANDIVDKILVDDLKFLTKD